jgi:hypothetical protein
MMKRIPLTQGKFALVETRDYAYLMKWKWCVSGTYAMRTARGRTIHMHSVVADRMGLDTRQKEVDHRNRNGLDNRRKNLRIATRSQNQANRPRLRSNTSGYIGVSRAAGGKWEARVKCDGRTYYLGRFDSKETAAAAYNAAATRLFGVFAHLNDVSCEFSDPRGMWQSNTSGYRGVSWRSSAGRWMATIKIDGHTTYLGCFDSVTDAARAYNRAAQGERRDSVSEPHTNRQLDPMEKP